MCIHECALNKKPLMTPTQLVMLSAFTSALAGVAIWEATRDVAP